MKFRVDPKDFYIFIGFCILFFYLSCILALNIDSLAQDGTFAGLNPFPAFSKEHIGATLGIFAIGMIAIFTSVSSYIFDKSKGLGLKLGSKEEKGYSRWANEKEVKAYAKVEKVSIISETAEAAGVPLINNGKEMYVDNGENHTLVIGATASGKTTSVVDPLVKSLGKKGESMVITDPKGEIYSEHASFLKEKGYNIIVLNFRDPEDGNAWNPLSLPYRLYKEGKIDKATELLEDVALNILKDPKNPGEPFWENNASDYFAGIALGLFQDAKDESEVNLNSISYMSTIGEERFGADNYMKEYFKLKGEDSSPYIFASSVINAPGETKGGVVSVFRQKIRIFASRENLSEMLAHTDFDIREIGKQKTAVFMVIHDEKTTYHALATIFIKQCYETLIATAQQEENKKLQYRTNFILDEFANMPPLKDVTSMVTAARSRAIRFTFIIQNFAQLNQVYGEQDAQTIRSNCGNLIYLITTELAALEEISKLCGEVKSKEKDKTVSTPLVTVSDLQKLKMNEVIIIKTRLNPFRTKLTPSYNINWGKEYPKTDFIKRETKDISLFDIKKHVKEKKKANLFNSIEEGNKPDTGAPNFGGFPPMNDETMPFNPSFDPTFGNSDMEDNRPFNPLSGFKDTKQGFKPKKSGVDIDALVKKIDAKIAELEEQEKLEKEKSSPVSMPEVVEDTKPESIYYEKKEEPTYKEELNAPILNPIKEEPTIETLDIEPRAVRVEPKEIKETNEHPKINVDRDSVVVAENPVTDDQFFDDFFGDDE